MSVRRRKWRDPETGASKESWIVDVVFEHADGRRERVRKVAPVQNKRAAEEYERQIRAQLLAPRPEQKEAPLFRDFVEDRWLPTYPLAAANRASSIRHKKHHLKNHIYPFFGKMRLDAITRETIERFFAQLALKERGKTGRRLSAKTRKNIGATFRRILASAAEWDVIVTIPRFPKIRVADSGFDFFVREESDRVIAATRSKEERVLLLFAFHTGARAGEQLAIEWRDIDWHNRLIVFRRAVSEGVVGPTKTGKERKVPMTSALEAALKSIRHLRGPLVFCTEKGSPLTLWQLHERLWGACRRAGLREIKWHECRHSFASQLVIGGTPLRQVQEWLGHSTITMTMRYAHLAPGGGREYLAALDSHGTWTAHERGAVTN